MNAKMLGAILSGLTFGSMAVAHAEEVPKKAEKKKGGEKSCSGDKKGGEKSCGGDKKGGEKSCGGAK